MGIQDVVVVFSTTSDSMFTALAGCFPSILRGSGCQGALFLDTNIFPGLFVLHLVTWCFGSGFLGSVPTTPAQVVMRIPTMDRNPETRAILSDPRAMLGDRVTQIVPSGYLT